MSLSLSKDLAPIQCPAFRPFQAPTKLIVRVSARCGVLPLEQRDSSLLDQKRLGVPCLVAVESTSPMKMNTTPSAWRNRVFLKIWLASLVSGTAVAAHDTAATWMMNLMSPSGLFISLMASLASLPFFLFTLPAGALADAFNAGIILRLANLWLAGCAGALSVLGWAGILNPMLLPVGV